MARGRKSVDSEASSSSTGPDLGALQREMMEIAAESEQLRQREQELVKRKADVEKRMTKALKDLGILHVVTPQEVESGRGKRGRRPGKTGRAARAEGAVKKRASGKRYTPEERKNAVEFVSGKVAAGATISSAIDEFNKSYKPRGKMPMNYQSLLRWREE